MSVPSYVEVSGNCKNMFERKICPLWVKEPLIKVQKYFLFCHFNRKSPRKNSFTNVHTLVRFLRERKAIKKIGRMMNISKPQLDRFAGR